MDFADEHASLWADHMKIFRELSMLSFSMWRIANALDSIAAHVAAEDRRNAESAERLAELIRKELHRRGLDQQMDTSTGVH